MKNDHGLSWAQAQYDRQEGPYPFCDEWGYTDGENEENESSEKRRLLLYKRKSHHQR